MEEETWRTVAFVLASSFIAGGGGAILGATLRGRHEREERLRAMMLSAADEFATGMHQAVMGVYETERGDSDEDDAAEREAKRLIGEADARLARVQLLFGDVSVAGDAADEAMSWLKEALDSRRLRFPEMRSFENDMAREVWQEDREEKAFAEAGKALRLFNDSARAALRRPRFTPTLRRRLSLRLRRTQCMGCDRPISRLPAWHRDGRSLGMCPSCSAEFVGRREEFQAEVGIETGPRPGPEPAQT